MINKYHTLVFVFCFCFAVIVAFLNSNTNSLFQLFSTKIEILAVVVYSLLFNAVSYTGIWIYHNSKKSL
jgi:hypothetical protein